MKIAVKRVYCPNCQKLVRVNEQTTGSHTLISCSKCGRQLYSFNGMRWKPEGEPAGVQ